MDMLEIEANKSVSERKTIHRNLEYEKQKFVSELKKNKDFIKDNLNVVKEIKKPWYHGLVKRIIIFFKLF